MRILFYGTPAFALPTLRILLAHHEVVAVVTQPDRPAGRGQRVQASPVKELALVHGLPVLQPERVREPGWAERLRGFAPEVAVVIAFGQILPRPVLDVPGRGSINVHASLLPRYRGAAPIAWAIIRGEEETGITTFQMDEGMDTGPMLLRRAVAIEPEETAGELAGRLAEVGAGVLLETLAGLDHLTPVAQDAGAATLAPRLRKADGVLDWASNTWFCPVLRCGVLLAQSSTPSALRSRGASVAAPASCATGARWSRLARVSSRTERPPRPAGPPAPPPSPRARSPPRAGAAWARCPCPRPSGRS